MQFAWAKCLARGGLLFVGAGSGGPGRPVATWAREGGRFRGSEGLLVSGTERKSFAVRGCVFLAAGACHAHTAVAPSASPRPL